MDECTKLWFTTCTTAVTVPGPPVHSVRPAGTCSDTVYNAPPLRLLAAALSRGHATGLRGAKLSTAQWYQKTLIVCIKAAYGGLVGNSAAFAPIGCENDEKREEAT